MWPLLPPLFSQAHAPAQPSPRRGLPKNLSVLSPAMAAGSENSQMTEDFQPRALKKKKKKNPEKYLSVWKRKKKKTGKIERGAEGRRNFVVVVVIFLFFFFFFWLVPTFWCDLEKSKYRVFCSCLEITELL